MIKVGDTWSHVLRLVWVESCNQCNQNRIMCQVFKMSRDWNVIIVWSRWMSG